MNIGERIQRVRGLIFDLDGTLYCQSPLRKRMRNEMLVSLMRNPIRGYREIRIVQAFRKAQEHLRTLEEPIMSGTQIELAAQWAQGSISDVTDVTFRWMNTAPLKHLPACLQPGLVAFLTDAKASGFRMGVFSDYPAQQKLEALGLTNYFEHIACAQDPHVGAFKPMPNGLLATARMLDMQSDEALYVGDRIDVDAEAARRAGMVAAIIGVNESEAGENWFGVPTFSTLARRLAEARLMNFSQEQNPQ